MADAFSLLIFSPQTGSYTTSDARPRCENMPSESSPATCRRAQPGDGFLQQSGRTRVGTKELLCPVRH